MPGLFGVLKDQVDAPVGRGPQDAGHRTQDAGLRDGETRAAGGRGCGTCAENLKPRNSLDPKTLHTRNPENLKPPNTLDPKSPRNPKP